jgi:hypothetical protein
MFQILEKEWKNNPFLFEIIVKEIRGRFGS